MAAQASQAVVEVEALLFRGHPEVVDADLADYFGSIPHADLLKAIADSLEEAADQLFIFTRMPPSQWRSVRTTNAIERLHEEFKRRIKTQTVLPSADTATILLRALLASKQICMRKVDGWQTLAGRSAN